MGTDFSTPVVVEASLVHVSDHFLNKRTASNASKTVFREWQTIWKKQ